MLGSKVKKRLKKEKEPLLKMEKSILALRNIKKGHKIKIRDLDFKSPGDGLPPSKLNMIVGKIAKKDFLKESLILLKDIR